MKKISGIVYDIGKFRTLRRAQRIHAAPPQPHRPHKQQAQVMHRQGPATASRAHREHQLACPIITIVTLSRRQHTHAVSAASQSMYSGV